MLEHWCDPAYSGFSWHGTPTTAHTFGRFTFPNLIASKQGNQHNCKINEIWAIRFQDADRGRLPRRKECHSIALPSLAIQITDLRSDTTTQNQTKFHMTHRLNCSGTWLNFKGHFFNPKPRHRENYAYVQLGWTSMQQGLPCPDLLHWQGAWAPYYFVLPHAVISLRCYKSACCMPNQGDKIELEQTCRQGAQAKSCLGICFPAALNWATAASIDRERHSTMVLASEGSSGLSTHKWSATLWILRRMESQPKAQHQNATCSCGSGVHICYSLS